MQVGRPHRAPQLHTTTRGILRDARRTENAASDLLVDEELQVAGSPSARAECFAALAFVSHWAPLPIGNTTTDFSIVFLTFALLTLDLLLPHSKQRPVKELLKASMSV